MTKEFCDIKRLSEYLDVSIPYIRKLSRAKLIPHYRFGNRLKFEVNEINEWLENQRVEQRKSILLF